MHVECTPRAGTPNSAIMDSEARPTNNRGNMSLPKGRKSASEGLSPVCPPNFGTPSAGGPDSVSLPVNEEPNSPGATPGTANGTGRKSLTSPVPSEADRRRQDAIARALGVSPTKSPCPAATPQDKRSKDFDFTEETETATRQSNKAKTPKRPMAEVQAQVDTADVSDTPKAPKDSKAGSKENKTKRTAGKENGTKKTK